MPGADAVLEPVEAHVDGFAPFLLERVVQDSISGAVVGSERSSCVRLTANPSVFGDKVVKVVLQDHFFRHHGDAEFHALVVCEVSVEAHVADVHCHELCFRSGDNAVE